MKTMILIVLLLLAVIGTCNAQPTTVTSTIPGQGNLPPVDQEGFITLNDHNQDGIDWIIAVDVEIEEERVYDLIFGDGFAEANLRIDPGTTIQFALEVVNDEVVQVRTIEIRGDDYYIECGSNDEAEAQVLFEPFDGNVEEYPVESGELFSGGLIINSLNTANKILNTRFEHMLGSITVIWDEWEVGEWNWPEELLGSCFAVKLGDNQAYCLLERVTVHRSFISGVSIIGDESQLDMRGLDEGEELIIEETYGADPDPGGEGNHGYGVGVYIGGVLCTVNCEDWCLITNNAGAGIRCGNDLDNPGLDNPSAEAEINLTNTIVSLNAGASLDAGIFLGGESHSLAIDEGNVISNHFHGIDLSGTGGHNVAIYNGSLVNENEQDGIFFNGNAHQNNLTIGEPVGNCEVNENQSEGITVRSDHNDILIKNESTVSWNWSDGIRFRGSREEHPELEHDEIACFDNDAKIEGSCEINNNGCRPGNPFGDREANGIHLMYTTDIGVTIRDQSHVNSNTLTGIKGEDSWSTNINVWNLCTVDVNEECGIWFDADEIRIPITQEWFQEGRLYCADCIVNIDTVSTVNSNEGGDDTHAGIAMYGLGHRVELRGESTVSLNNSHGIRMDCLDFVQLQTDECSEINNNEGAGVWLWRPGEAVLNTTTEINQTDIQENGLDGILLEDYWMSRGNGLPVSPWPEPPSDHGMQASITNIVTVGEAELAIGQNGQNGIRIVGTTIHDASLYLLIENCKVFSSFDDGIEFNFLDYTDGDDIVVVNNTTVSSNGGDGVKITQGFGETRFEFTSLRSCSNTGNGLNIIDATFALYNDGTPNVEIGSIVTTWGGSKFEENVQHGIRLADYNSGIFLHLTQGDSIRNNTMNGIEIGLPDAAPQDEDTIRVFIDNCLVAGNGSAGLHLAETDEDFIPTDIFVYNSTFKDQIYGIWDELHAATHFWIAPKQPEPGPDETSEISYFLNNADWAILIESPFNEDPYLATCLLIDKVQFNELSAAGGAPPNLLSHIKLVGQIRGGRDEFGITGGEDFGTIRRCQFGYGNYGVYLQSEGEGENIHYPDVHVRNNFFIDVYDAGIVIDFDDDDNNVPTTYIYNNTFVSDGTPNCNTAIRLMPTGTGTAALGDEAIYYVIFDGSFSIGVDQQENTQNPPVYYNSCFNLGNGTDCIGCSFDGICPTDTDPQRFAADSERLIWSSPCINGGNDLCWVLDSTLMDEGEWVGEEWVGNWFISDQDMGCTGGGRFAGILNHKPHNIIEGGTYNEDVEITVSDEYEVIGDVLINNGVDLTIDPEDEDPGILIFFDDDCEIKVYGTIHVNGNEYIEGDPNPNVYFYKTPGSTEWDWIKIYLPDDECNLTGCDIRDAYYGVYAYGGTAGNQPEISIDNCLLRECDNANLYISGDAWIDCEDSYIYDSENEGVYILNNEAISRLNRCEITGNGSSSSDAGIKISASAPTIIFSTIGLNYSRGFYLSSSGLYLNGNDNDANVIYNNGPDNQSGSTGAELYVTSSSQPMISYTNIWDLRDEDEDGVWTRDGIFAFKNGGDLFVFDHCYYGGDDSWPDLSIIDFDDEPNPNAYFTGCFYDDDMEDVELTYRVGTDIPPVTDALTDFEYALSLMNAGRYAEAIPYFWSYIRGDESNLKINALQRILWCTRRAGYDLAALQDDYLALADEMEDAPREVRFMARKLACLCALYKGYPNEAVARMMDIRDLTPSVSDSIELEMSIAFAELIAAENGNQVDALGNYDNRMQELWALLDKADNITDGDSPTLPAAFSLEPPFPNPFNSAVQIRYALPEVAYVQLSVFDLTGRLVDKLVCERQNAGEYQLVWAKENLASGLYLLRLKADGQVKTRKMTMIK